MNTNDITTFFREHTNIEKGEFTVSKFYHGRAEPDKKVLFLFAYDNSYPGLVKVSRSEKANKKLERECRMQEKGEAEARVFSVPKVLFSGLVGGYFVYAEEVLTGVPIGRSRALTFLPRVLSFQNSIPKGKPLTTKKLAEYFGVYRGCSDTYDYWLNELEQNDGELATAWSHGDMTFMNLIEEKNGRVYLIDWELAGIKNIWGLDFVHYLARCFNTKTAEDFDNALLHSGVEFDRAYMRRAYAADRLFDYLYKNNREGFFEVAGHISYET